MITKTNIKLHLRGENFSPRKLSELATVSFTNIIEKGETRIPFGVHKGKIAHYGRAVLETETGENNIESDYNVALYKLLQSFYESTYRYLEESGVDNISLWIHYIFDKEGSSGLEFRPESLLLLGQMNIPVAINMSYYENFSLTNSKIES